MSILADLVEVVIGVDTHKDTHTAVLLDTRTRGVLARATVTTDPDGYADLVALAEQHSVLRAWALEAPAATARAWPGTWPTPVSWSSNWTGRCARPAAAERSPTRSTPNAPPATHSPVPAWRNPRPDPGGPALQARA